MALSKVILVLVPLAASIAVAGTGLLALAVPAGRQSTTERDRTAQPPPEDARWSQEDGRPAHSDRHGDALPDGAVARLGALRWRHPGFANALMFSPDGKTLASVCAGDLLLWNTTTGKVVRQLYPPSPGPVTCRFGSAPQFMPDGKTLLAQTVSGDVAFWDVASGKLTRTMAAPQVDQSRREAPNLGLSPDGRVVAVGAKIDTVALLDSSSGRLISPVGGHRAAIYRIAFSPDGATIALATRSPSVQLWDVATGKLVGGIKDHGDQFAYSVAFAPDGKTIASGSRDLVILSDAATGKEVGRLQAKMKTIDYLAFTPDGKALLSGGEDCKVRVWDLDTKKQRFTLDGRLGIGRSLALSRDGKMVALGGDYNAIRLWDVGTGKELFTHFEGHDTPLDWVAYTPDGNTLISCGANARLRFWDTVTWKEKRRLWAGAYAVALAPDGKRMAAVGYGKKLRVWDSSTGADICKVVSTEAQHGAVFCQKGNALVSIDWRPPGQDTSAHGTAHVILWDVMAGKLIRQVSLPDVQPQSLALTPDDRMAIVGDGEGLIHLVDLDEGKKFLVLRGHRHYVTALALSADGKTLLSGGLDRSVRLWDLVSGHEIAPLEGHRRAVAAVALSPDGRLAATAGGSAAHPFDVAEPRRIRLWDVVSGKEIAHFEGHTADVTSLAFSPDGARLVSGMQDTTVLVWDATGLSHLPALEGLGQELDPLWNDLASVDTFKAHQAVWKMVATPERTSHFLKERLPPAQVNDKQVRRCITDLDSDEFAVRSAAVTELKKLGHRAAPALRESLAGKPSAEVRRQVEEVLAGLRLTLSPEVLQRLRAVQVLERIGSTKARRLLETLVKGAPAAPETQEAKASLERLAGRASPVP
jgi:WD40 repeat protein